MSGEIVKADPTTWETAQAQAITLSRARGFVPAAYYNKPDNVLAAWLYGRALGFDLTTSMRMIHVVDGKPTLSAEAMLALVRRAGHSVSGEMSAERAKINGRRTDTGDAMTVEFTWADAERAGLTRKDNWKTYPAAMLWARAVSQLCRVLFPDVLLGMAYVPEELGATVDEAGNVLDVESEETPAAEMTARQTQEAKDAEMRAWVADLDDEGQAGWSAWKAAHQGWHKRADSINEAYIALRDLVSATRARAGEEPFAAPAGDDDEIVDAEVVDEAPEPAENEPGDAPGSDPRPESPETLHEAPTQPPSKLDVAKAEIRAQIEEFVANMTAANLAVRLALEGLDPETDRATLANYIAAQRGVLPGQGVPSTGDSSRS